MLSKHIDYLQYVKLSSQGADSVLLDAYETGERLENVAGIPNYCSDPDLRELGYRKINFQKHRYVLIYRAEGRYAVVEAVYHMLQDYENIFAREIGIR